MAAAEIEHLLSALKSRFDKNMIRHSGIRWDDVLQKLQSDHHKLESLKKMEDTGGEPDVIDYDATTNEFIFCDCSPESPKGRRSLCYDQKAHDDRKEFKPVGAAMVMAAEIGIEMTSEEQYRYLQTLGKFDTKTSSWLKTPEPVRKLDGAIFGDFRYGQVFIYHNGASSYYASRGFRGILRV
jgi:hypothetical protein